MPLDPTSKHPPQAVQDRRRFARHAVLTCRHPDPVPVGPTDTLARSVQAEAAFSAEEPRGPGAFDQISRRWAADDDFDALASWSSRSVPAALVLPCDELACGDSLVLLDVAEIRPEQIENHANMLAAGNPPLVRRVAVGRRDGAEAGHGSLKAEKDLRDTVAGLRDGDQYLSIAGPACECPCDRAAFSVEEAGRPGELEWIEGQDGMIERLFDAHKSARAIL